MRRAGGPDPRLDPVEERRGARPSSSSERPGGSAAGRRNWTRSPWGSMARTGTPCRTASSATTLAIHVLPLPAAPTTATCVGRAASGSPTGCPLDGRPDPQRVGPGRRRQVGVGSDARRGRRAVDGSYPGATRARDDVGTGPSASGPPGISRTPIGRLRDARGRRLRRGVRPVREPLPLVLGAEALDALVVPVPLADRAERRLAGRLEARLRRLVVATQSAIDASRS